MSVIESSGFLARLQINTAETLNYALSLQGQHPIPLNPLLGKSLSLKFSGSIQCIYCQRSIKKSFNKGYCFVCFKQLARCDQCIIKPELCHFHLNTCREPDWGKRVCMQNHIVYLSYTSGIKVGITRKANIPNRWYDQGATLALPIFEVKSRLLSGLLEVSLKAHFNDKTNWRKMLSSNHYDTDLYEVASSLFSKISMTELLSQYPQFQSCMPKPLYGHTPPLKMHYPQIGKLDKINSFNAEKTPCVSGTLIGMKGQYLIFDTGVININKYQGHHIRFEANTT